MVLRAHGSGLLVLKCFWLTLVLTLALNPNPNPNPDPDPNPNPNPQPSCTRQGADLRIA